MNGTQITIAIVYSIATAIGLAIYFYVAWSTKRGKAEGGDKADLHKMEKGENWWAIIAVLLLVGFFVATWAGIPWLSRATARENVQVDSLQFAWIVNPPTIQKGTINFLVTARDVNHGFGLYDPDDKLVSQINAVPGTTSTLTTDVDKPGTYTIRCLEYCGVNHHQMVGRIEVTE
jgi:cytochrome c oxidase subunit 2